MRKAINFTSMSAVALSVFMAGSAFATNGYFTHGNGTKNKSMAGAGIALPQDAIDTVNNPAAAVWVGDSMQIGGAVFNPNRSYEIGPSQANGNFGAFSFGAGELDSGSNYFVIPHFSRSWQRSEDTAFAFSFYGRGGMNTDWSGGAAASFDPDGPGPAPVMSFPGTFGAGTAGVDLSQALMDFTWSKKLNDDTSFGIAAVVALQAFEAVGVSNFAGFTEHFAASGGTSFPSNLSNNGHDTSYGIGLKLGFHKNISEQASFAISYQTEIGMGEFDSYADLFAEDGDFDIPANLKAGLTFKANDKLTWSFDIEHTWFSDVGSVGNSIMNLFSCPTAGQNGTNLAGCLGGEMGGGFGWDDMTTYKLGFQYDNGSDMVWRFGISNGDMPIPNTEMTFNLLAPAVVETHLTFGFTKDAGNDREWNFAFMHALENDETGMNNFDPSQMVSWEMDQFEIELSYGWKF